MNIMKLMRLQLEWHFKTFVQVLTNTNLLNNDLSYRPCLVVYICSNMWMYSTDRSRNNITYIRIKSTASHTHSVRGRSAGIISYTELNLGAPSGHKRAKQKRRPYYIYDLMCICVCCVFVISGTRPLSASAIVLFSHRRLCVTVCRVFNVHLTALGQYNRCRMSRHTRHA